CTGWPVVMAFHLMHDALGGANLIRHVRHAASQNSAGVSRPIARQPRHVGSPATPVRVKDNRWPPGQRGPSFPWRKFHVQTHTHSNGGALMSARIHPFPDTGPRAVERKLKEAA